MYSNIKSVQVLIALLKEHGIDHIVLTPGNRNVPVIRSVESDPFFRCFSVVDERSASFFALGLIHKLKRPVAICCTSGTALLNFASAVAEAFFQKLPLVVISANRDPRALYQNEAQMVPQTEAFGSNIRKVVQLPIVLDSNDEIYCNRIINETILEASHRGFGPVQIDVPMSDNLTDCSVQILPKQRKIVRFEDSSYANFWLDIVEKLRRKKILLVLGQSFPLTKEERLYIENFLRKFDCVLLTDHLSNYKGDNVIENTELVLQKIQKLVDKNIYMPDVILTVFGNYVTPWSIQSIIKGWQNIDHWHIDSKGNIVDQFNKLTTVIECEEFVFFRKVFELADKYDDCSPTRFSEGWQTYSIEIDQPNVEYSDIYTCGEALRRLPENSSLHLGNSATLRIAQLFKIHDSISIYCNRGTNGIDGSLSSTVGLNSVNETMTFILIGDLSFFYDATALWNNNINNRLRIMINNNSGAGVLQLSAGKSVGLSGVDFTVADHNNSAQGWAESMGFKYICATSKAEFDERIDEFFFFSEKPVVFEVFTSRDKNIELLKTYQEKWTKVDLNLSDVAFKAKRKIKNLLNKF